MNDGGLSDSVAMDRGVIDEPYYSLTKHSLNMLGYFRFLIDCECFPDFNNDFNKISNSVSNSDNI